MTLKRKAISKRVRDFSLSLKFKIWRLPCVVCGIPYNIHCDHIIPYSLGGENAENNVQPLCHQCNQIKKNRRSNEQIADVIVSRGLSHFVKGVYQWDTRFVNPYEGPNLYQWERLCKDRVRHAEELFNAFLDRAK